MLDDDDDDIDSCKSDGDDSRPYVSLILDLFVSK